jgi:hypothetical protein
MRLDFARRRVAGLTARSLTIRGSGLAGREAAAYMDG